LLTQLRCRRKMRRKDSRKKRNLPLRIERYGSFDEGMFSEESDYCRVTLTLTVNVCDPPPSTTPRKGVTSM
jgi:hypothetical protein